MYRYANSRIRTENAARIEAFTYTADTGMLEVIYSVGTQDERDVYTPLERKTVTLAPHLHASTVRTLTSAIEREVLTILTTIGKLPEEQPTRAPAVELTRRVNNGNGGQ